MTMGEVEVIEIDVGESVGLGHYLRADVPLLEGWKHLRNRQKRMSSIWASGICVCETAWWSCVGT